MSKPSYDDRYKTFLQVLSEFSGMGPPKLAKACKKQPANMSGYINGSSRVGARVARSVWEAYCKWNCDTNNMSLFKPLLEINDISKVTIPESAGVYMLYNSSAQVIYIGKAGNFKVEVAHTLKRKVPVALRMGPILKKQKPPIGLLARYISLYEIADPKMRANLEALLIRVSINHTHNSNLGHIKRA
jgi:hypothetical protein